MNATLWPAWHYRAMPRFFFHVIGGRGFPDAKGVEFTDASAACGEAVTLAGEILRDLNGKMSEGGDWRLDVTDAAGDPVGSLRFSVTRP